MFIMVYGNGKLAQWKPSMHPSGMEAVAMQTPLPPQRSAPFASPWPSRCLCGYRRVTTKFSWQERVGAGGMGEYPGRVGGVTMKCGVSWRPQVVVGRGRGHPGGGTSLPPSPPMTRHSRARCIPLPASHAAAEISRGGPRASRGTLNVKI